MGRKKEGRGASISFKRKSFVLTSSLIPSPLPSFSFFSLPILLHEVCWLVVEKKKAGWKRLSFLLPFFFPLALLYPAFLFFLLLLFPFLSSLLLSLSCHSLQRERERRERRERQPSPVLPLSSFCQPWEEEKKRAGSPFQDQRQQEGREEERKAKEPCSPIGRRRRRRSLLPSYKKKKACPLSSLSFSFGPRREELSFCGLLLPSFFFFPSLLRQTEFS